MRSSADAVKSASSEAELRERLATAEAELAANQERIQRIFSAGSRSAEFYVTGLSHATTPKQIGEGLYRTAKEFFEIVVAQPGEIDLGIYVAENPYRLPTGASAGDLSRETLETAWKHHSHAFELLTVPGPEGRDLFAIAIPNPQNFSEAIAMIVIDSHGAQITDFDHAESVLRAFSLSSVMHLERIAATEDSRLAAESAHAAARIQMRLVNPIELCSAMAVALEELQICPSVVGAAAIDLTKEEPSVAGQFGEFSLADALRARSDDEFAKRERIRTMPVTLDGVTEGLLTIRVDSGTPTTEDEMLGSIGAAIAGSASRFRAATTIDLLRRSTTRQLVEAQERDRAIVAADIHDGALQQLGATAMRLELIRARAAAGDSEAMEELIDRCATDIRSCTRELRNLLMELRPQVLDDNGLAAALGELGNTAEDTRVRVNVEMPDEIEDDLAITIFRIVQEALNNIRKHAHANNAWVDVSHTADAIRVEIRDDGVGFEGAASGPSSAGQHFGLLGMRERTRMMGGEFTIVGHSGGGTTVTAVLPSANKRNQSPPAAA